MVWILVSFRTPGIKDFRGAATSNMKTKNNNKALHNKLIIITIVQWEGEFLNKTVAGSTGPSSQH